MKKLFAIDPRGLALFRMAIGVLLLIDLAIRASDLRSMYTDAGMFPRPLVASLFNTVWNWSFHFGGGSTGFEAALFVIAGALAIALTLGWQTRLATIGSWLFLLSVHHRVPAILSGADFLLRMLLFWGMFLPLEGSWARDRRARIDAPVVSIATAAVLLQIALMYLMSAISKTNEHWLRGDALAGMLSHDFFASRIGAWLLQFPMLLRLVTWGSFALEWFGPVFLFVPWRNATVRAVILALFAAMHIGIAVCMDVGLFSYVALAGLLLFVPSEIWNRLFAKSPVRSKTVIDWHPLPQSICAIALGFVLVGNLNALPMRPLRFLAPETWKPFAIGLGLDQHWGMFGAIPTNNGWYVARATLADGSEVDLLRNGAPVDWSRPAFPASVYPNANWQKLFREMAYYDELGYQVYRLPVAEFMCREWNARHPAQAQVDEFEFVYCSAALAPSLLRPSSKFVRQPLVHLELGGE